MVLILYLCNKNLLMYNFKYVFSQLTIFLNRSKFNRFVAKYNGDKYVKHFSCWKQL